MARTAVDAPASGKAELPLLVAQRRRCRGRRGVGPARWLAVELALPGQERRVAEIGAPTGDLGSECATRVPPLAVADDRVGDAQQETHGTIGDLYERDRLTGAGPVEDVGEQDPEVRGAAVAERIGEVVAQRLGAHARRGAEASRRPRVDPADRE